MICLDLFSKIIDMSVVKSDFTNFFALFHAFYERAVTMVDDDSFL